MLLPSLIAYRASFLVAVGWHMQLSHALGAVFLRCGDHRRLPLLGHAAARVGERGVGIAQRSISSTASRWHALTARFDLLNVSTRLGAVEPDGTKENGIRLKIRCQIAQSGGPSPRARLAACVSSKPPQRPRPVIPIRRGFYRQQGTLSGPSGSPWTCAQRETLTIAGFALDGRKWDGLYLGRRKGKDLIYAGKVDRGFDAVRRPRSCRRSSSR